MEVSASVLASEIEADFDGVQVEFSDDGEESWVIVTDSFAAGFYHPNELESFGESVREFVLQYTQEWVVSDVCGNRLEGYYQVVLSQSASSE